MMTGPRRYMKRRLEIDAWQWQLAEDPQSEAEAIVEWIEDNRLADSGGADYDDDVSGGIGPHGEDWGCLEIDTLEGLMTVAPYDYVIRGIKGEFYACKPDVFEASYESLEPVGEEGG